MKKNPPSSFSPSSLPFILNGTALLYSYQGVDAEVPVTLTGLLFIVLFLYRSRTAGTAIGGNFKVIFLAMQTGRELNHRPFGQWTTLYLLSHSHIR